MAHTTIGTEKYIVVMVKQVASVWLHVRVMQNYPQLELTAVAGLLVLVSIACPQIDLNMHLGVKITQDATIQGEYNLTERHGKMTIYKKR